MTLEPKGLLLEPKLGKHKEETNSAVMDLDLEHTIKDSGQKLDRVRNSGAARDKDLAEPKHQVRELMIRI